MKRKTHPFRAILTLLVATAFFLTETHAAQAQSLRYLNRTVEAGKQIEFQWLNYDERTCKDNGYPKLIVERAPSLGKFRTSQQKFTMWPAARRVRTRPATSFRVGRRSASIWKST